MKRIEDLTRLMVIKSILDDLHVQEEANKDRLNVLETTVLEMIRELEG